MRPNMFTPTLTAWIWLGQFIYRRTAHVFMCTHYRSSRLDWLYLYHQQVPNSRNWGGGQFLTRSHRTIPTRHRGLRITRHQKGEMTVFLLWRILPNSFGTRYGNRTHILTLRGLFPIPFRRTEHGRAREVRTPVSALKGPCH